MEGGIDMMADLARERKWGVQRRLRQKIGSRAGEFTRESGGCSANSGERQV